MDAAAAAAAGDDDDYDDYDLLDIVCKSCVCSNYCYILIVIYNVM